MVTKDWEGMKVRGPLGAVFVTQDGTKHYVKDGEGNTLFESEEYETSDVAIQWAINFQSSEGTAK